MDLEIKSYKKRPIAIQAVQITAENAEQVAFWCGARFDRPVDDSTILLTIPTLEGNFTATVTDWVAKGIKGEFYPIKTEIFSETYDEDTEVK